MCVYRATQDGSWGLTFMVYFNHDIQVLSRWRNSRIILRSLVWLIQYTNFFEFILFNFSWITPDGSNRCSFYRQCSQSSLLTRCNQLWLNLMSINLFFITNFDSSPSFCWLLPIGCATALPMGVAPEAIAKNFGYRLKKIDRLVPYISSHNILLTIVTFSIVLPFLWRKPPSQRRGELVLFLDIFLSPTLSFCFYCTHLFPWYVILL
jgi:hypothetical protein